MIKTNTLLLGASVLLGIAGVASGQPAPTDVSRYLSNPTPSLFVKEPTGTVVLITPDGKSSVTDAFEVLIRKRPSAGDTPTILEWKNPSTAAGTVPKPPASSKGLFGQPRPDDDDPLAQCTGEWCKYMQTLSGSGSRSSVLGNKEGANRTFIVKGVGSDAIFLERMPATR